MITVYTKKPCPQCEAVKAQLTANNIEFNEVPIDDWALSVAREHGWTSAPIVIDDTHPELSFGGNNQQTLTALIAANK
ncbi:glutaredoxin family protein [uncultured Corynebacterium sp.]|uniref:glutaredoxin family protein n=1 Tax=uncultured Corynebacterium sp. TaxID=159447 RepID=UPI002596CB5C|nr:glutaredoxin family protein [uncultured Corynebacterium sp.]